MKTETKTESAFLPEGYKQPTSSSSYMKLKKGENKLRILSKPIIGWLDWGELDGKRIPLRYEMDNKPPTPQMPNKPIKHFWALVVWNYSEEAISILELTQSSIQGEISRLVNDEDWGAPFGYDIKIIREGEAMETKYSVTAVPHKPVGNEIKDAFLDKYINLEALFTGDDPFTR